MEKLRVDNLDYSIMDKSIIRDISLNIDEGEFIGLIGPNGCGKSTLLKNIYKVYKPDQGTVYIDGDDIGKIGGKETAKKMSVMVQENNVEFDIDVLDMVMLGRYAYKKLFSDSTKEDMEITRKALDAVGMRGYENRSFFSLSGGEKQRALIARALTQQARLIILDEPTNHLDIGYQYQVMSILKKQAVTVFASVHDLNIALYYCDRVILMDQGEIVARGKPDQVITSEMVRRVFNINARVEANAVMGKKQIIFMPD